MYEFMDSSGCTTANKDHSIMLTRMDSISNNIPTTETITLYDVSVHLCQICIPLFQGYDKNPLHILTLFRPNKKKECVSGNGSENFR